MPALDARSVKIKMQNTEEYFKIQNTEEAESDLKLEYTEED